MLRPLTRAWSWLVDGTTEATAWLLDRLRKRAVVTVALDADGGVVKAADGTALGRLTGDTGSLRLEPASAAAHLAGASVEVACPPDWLFRRKLDPVAAQGAPFLHAFVRHQIDRLTPWRADDVDICIHHAPLPREAGRLSVEIGVLPRRLTSPALGVLRACRPASLVLVALAPQDGRRFAMPVDDRSAERLARLRPAVTLGLVAYLFAWPAALGWVWWSSATVADEIAAADQVIDARKAVLAAAARHDQGTGAGATTLLRLREQHPRAVDLLDALAAALPDSAYATAVTIAGRDIRVSGVSTDTARLVPALETSGRFSDASFFDTTTRVEGGGIGDRFHIAMQARAPEGAPP